jgi:uridine kinase
MKRTCVIAINSVSGGGKTSLARLVQESLPDATLFCFDDFDATNVYPDDYYDWWVRGGNLEEFDCPGMRAAVDGEIRHGRT